MTISIHALREEGDDLPPDVANHVENFYPRPPRGGRQNKLDYYFPVFAFLSTPSARRATSKERAELAFTGISIHALREEGDLYFVRVFVVCFTFLSTPSARRATRTANKR